MASISATTLLEYSYKDTNNDIQTGSDSLTSSATGKDFDEAFNNLNNVIDSEVNVILLNLQTTVSTSTVITNINSNYSNQPYNIPGSYLNLTAISKLFNSVNSYGSNSTVDYVSPIYKEYTTIKNDIPVFPMTYNSFLLFEFSLNEHFLNQHNLLIFTPYIYSYKSSIIFGSVDQSLFLTKKSLSSDNKIKICFTCNKIIADTYSKQNYFISRFPSDYTNRAYFNILIRFGRLKNNISLPVDINSYCTTSYNIFDGLDESNLYTSQQIISSQPTIYNPQIDNNQEILIQNYNNIANYLTGILHQPESTYPYFAKEAGTNYAIQSFYDSINLSIPINIYGNNTCENYFMTNVRITNDKEKYLYILAPNQFTFSAAITSNIQIYNANTNNEIENGSIITAPNLNTMSYNNYPFPISNLFTTYQIYEYNFTSINSTAEPMDIVVTERISYNQTNFNHTNYSLINTSVVFTGNKLTSSEILYLQETYDINVVESS